MEETGETNLPPAEQNVHDTAILHNEFADLDLGKTGTGASDAADDEGKTSVEATVWWNDSMTIPGGPDGNAVSVEVREVDESTDAISPPPSPQPQHGQLSENLQHEDSDTPPPPMPSTPKPKFRELIDNPEPEDPDTGSELIEVVLEVSDESEKSETTPGGLTLDDMVDMPTDPHLRSLWCESHRNLPFFFNKPLWQDETDVTLAQRAGIRDLYGSQLKQMVVDATVIHKIKEADEETFVARMLDVLGGYMSRQLFMPHSEGETVVGFSMLTALILAQKGSTFGQTDGGYLTSFAPAHHAGIFGWMRYIDFNIKILYVDVKGADVWDGCSFHELLQHYRALPVISLVASIIAFKPLGTLKQIIICGLGPYARLMQEMWDAIPQKAPFPKCDELVELLCEYPFGLPCIREMFIDDQGILGVQEQEEKQNMFALKTTIEWQAIVMKARHGVFQPTWEFEADAL
jgi:hypothetical protein